MSSRDPFDFSGIGPERGARSPVDPPRLTPGSRFDGRVAVPSERSARAQPSGGLAKAALGCAVVGAVAVGFAAFASLSSIDITSSDPLGDFLFWGTVVGLGIFLDAVAVVLAVIALGGRRKSLAVGALVAAVLLLPGAGLVGLQAGLGALHAHVARDLADAGGSTLDTLQQSLERLGPATEPVREWLDREFGPASA